MDWLPVWWRKAGQPRLPRASTKSRNRANSSSQSSTDKDQQEDGGDTSSPEPPSTPPPPPPPLPPLPPPGPRRFAAAVLSVSLFMAAAVALLHPVAATERRAGSSNSNSSSIASNLPFLEPDDGVRVRGRTDATHWVRVRSSAAMHPALYVPADGLIYCPIAKVACAEWRKTLRWMLGIPDWDSGPIHDQDKNGIPVLARRRVRDVELMMNDESWLKFVVVRDPADRLLSAFLNKCVGGEWQNCPYVEFMPQRFPGEVERDDATDAKFLGAIAEEPREVFRDFTLGVRKDVRIGGCTVNSHWRPQYCFCSIARFRDSYHVIPFANMSAEAVNLVDHMRRASPERAELLREFIVRRFSSNQDAKAQGATTKREQYFSAEALDVIKMVYRKDYQHFGEYFEEHTASMLRR